MSEQIEQALTPKLRFPEFKTGADWDPQTLGGVCEMQAGSFVSASEIAERRTVGTYPCYGGNGLRGYTKTHTHSGRFSLVGRQGALCGNVNLVDGQFHATEHAVVVTPKIGVDTHWLYYALGLLHLNQYATGQAQPGLSVQVLKEVSVAVPTEQGEQQRIALCVTSLDDLIAAEGRKLEALRTHKKGLMQQLFPQPGETRPRLRFPEFHDAGEWEEKPLGELLLHSPEYGVNASAVPYSKDLPTYIRITDINDDGRFITEGRTSVAIEAKENNFLHDGDIVLARTGASVGKSYRYRPEDGRLVFAGFLIRVRPNPKKLLTDFLTGFLATRTYWDWVSVTSTRSGQPGINGTEYASLPIPIPPIQSGSQGPKEQQQIADCLTSLDALASAQANRIAVLQAFKRGLMQNLFPSSEYMER